MSNDEFPEEASESRKAVKNAENFNKENVLARIAHFVPFAS